MQFDRSAFERGVRRACEAGGSPDLAGFVVKLAEFGAAGSYVGGWFEKGAQSLLDRIGSIGGEPEYETARKKSLLRKLLPWALAMGGGALALQYGNAWGRHAALTGNDRGPVSGTLKAILEAATGNKFEYVGKGNIPPNDRYHRPLSNEQYNNLVTYGSELGPSPYDKVGKS